MPVQLVPYKQILRMAARRVNAVSGTTAATLEAAYMTSPLTSTQIGNTDFTLSMIRDNLAAVIGEIVSAYSATPEHPYRAANTTQTAGIADKGLAPGVDSAGKPIAGVYGSIRSLDVGTAGEILTPKPLPVVRSIVEDTDNYLKGNHFHYAWDGNRLRHTVSSAAIDVVTFLADDVLTANLATAAAPIPDVCLGAAWCGLVANLFVDDEYLQQVQVCAAYYQTQLERMRQGQLVGGPAPQ